MVVELFTACRNFGGVLIDAPTARNSATPARNTLSVVGLGVTAEVATGADGCGEGSDYKGQYIAAGAA